MRNLILLSFLLLGVVGCAAHEPFVPAKADLRSPDNRRVALYEIRTGAGDWNMITVKIWPEGITAAAQGDVGIPSPPSARLVLEVRNDWTSAVTLPVGELKLSAKTRKGSQPAASPAGTPASVLIAPGEEKTVRVEIPLPAPSRDVRSYELRWALTAEDKSYRQTTTFVRDEDDAAGDYYYMPYYDPFWYGWGGYGSASPAWRSGVRLGIGISN